jgi:ATP-dependent Lhr-like helicase
MEMDPSLGLEDLGPPRSPDLALAALQPCVAEWFSQRHTEPTPIQRLAWPALAAGKNVLLSAPTGSGKTLAAFLPILDRLRAEPPGWGVRCLYVAPLKALCKDAARNLRAHLADLAEFLPGPTPELRVSVRTGDTPAHERRELLTEPPDILLTTPESLAVLLSQPRCLDLFAGLRWVVVDELHALLPTKRGADLSLSLERIQEQTSGPLQRLGLSATATPLAEAARFLVGDGRPCAIACVEDSTELQLSVEPLEELRGFVAQLLDRLEPELTTRRTILVFTNIRSLAERLAWALRRRHPEWADQVGVHHSALSGERRDDVERRLKHGQMKVVLTSTSLELGVDIGSVDLVVLVHPPGDVVRFLQRIGRSGHGPGRCRRGLVLTAGPSELLEATVTARSSRANQCEPLRVPVHPLDVLCQQLLGMATQQVQTPDTAFARVRRAYPYRNLPREDFDACLDYLTGRRSDGKTWLPARLSWQDETFRVRNAQTARLLRQNLGTILTEEPRSVRLAVPDPGEDNASEFAPTPQVGQLDLAFADRLQPGDRFLLDGRCLEYRRADGSGLLVQEVQGSPAVPVWGGEGWPLSPELARRLFVLRVQAAEAMREEPDALASFLRREYGLDGAAVDLLVGYFLRQECVSEIPDISTLLVELVGGEAVQSCYFHTPLNRTGNDALARVLVRRLACERGMSATSVVADLGFAVILRGSVGPGPQDWRALLAVDRFETDLDAALAESPRLRAHFRRVAYTGLMLLRNPLGRRRRVGGRDWAERCLFDQARTSDPNCVLLRQAVRGVREECCDVAAARAWLDTLGQTAIHVRRLSGVSPFAESWTQLTAGPAEATDTPADALRRLHATLTGGGQAACGSIATGC